MSGRIIVSGGIDNLQHAEISTKSLPKGAFIVRINNGRYTSNLRFVKITE